MSEYTNYFAVKASSEQEVQEKLNLAKIKSIVNADEKDYFFDSKYQRNGIYNWVVVVAPANRGFDDNQMYFHEDQFDAISAIFETTLHFFQQEDFIDWNITLKTGNTIIEKEFAEDVEVTFNDKEKATFSQCFNRCFTDLEEFLQAGKASDFLNYIGIPYMEMEDQDLISDMIFSNKYSLRPNEIDC